MLETLEICPKCQTYLRSYNDRKQAEYDLVSRYDTKDTGDGKFWYLVDALWVNKWKKYVRSEHVTDIRDMAAPGLIDNARLFEKDSNIIRKNMRLQIDYIGVNARVWWLFMHVHGGGPGVCREELDIYSTEGDAEIELKLDELRGSDAKSIDYARRVSREFVDVCKGDLEAYALKYGSAADSEDRPANNTDERASADRDTDDVPRDGAVGDKGEISVSEPPRSPQ